MRRIGTILIATAIAGTLDLLAAFFFAGLAGVTTGEVLRVIASGPFGDAMLAIDVGAEAIGVLVHYGLMVGMAAAYVLAAERMPTLLRQPVGAGLLYGFVLWIVMYWIVRPIRWPALPLPHDPVSIGNQLFSHCLLVGLPIALVTARRRRPAFAWP